MSKAKKLLGKLLFQILLKMFSFYFCFIRLNPETHYNISGIYNINKKRITYLESSTSSTPNKHNCLVPVFFSPNYNVHCTAKIVYLQVCK